MKITTCFSRCHLARQSIKEMTFNSFFSLLHNEASRGIASKGASKTKNAKQVDYRGLVATATSGLDTINISGSREQKNHIYRYFRIDYHIQLSLIYL